MYDRELGCRTIGCFAGALLILIFFGMLLSLTQNLAAKKKRQDQHVGDAASPGLAASKPITGLPIRQDDEDATNITRLPELVNAVRSYAADNDGKLPPMESANAFRSAVFPKYVADPAVLESPSGLPYSPNPMLSGKRLDAFKNPGEVVAFYQPLPDRGPGSDRSRAVVFLSGVPREVSATEWRHYPVQMTAPVPAASATPAAMPSARTP